MEGPYTKQWLIDEIKQIVLRNSGGCKINYIISEYEVIKAMIVLNIYAIELDLFIEQNIPELGVLRYEYNSREKAFVYCPAN